MNLHDMTEQAYRNGYAKGYADAKKNEKHGRWIVGGACNHVPYRIKNPEKWVTYACSQCGYSNGRKQSNYCTNCGAIMDLPNITENTRKALEKMGENVHSEIDFDYAAEDD